MAVISSGTCSINQNTNTLTFSGATGLSGIVKAGHEIKFDGEPSFYHFTTDMTDNVNGAILETYQGTNKVAANYQIFKDFYGHNLARIQSNTRDNWDLIDRNFGITDDELDAAGAPSTKDQITTKIYIGEPVLNKEWGFLKWTPGVVITKIRLGTDNFAPNGNLTLDMAADGTYQAINLTVPVNNLWKESSTLTTTVDAGEFTKFKWTDVPSSPGNDWYIEITWHSGTALVTRYDFLGMVLGDVVVGRIIGKGYKPPVKSKLFGLHWEWLDFAPIGSNVILEVYKNDAAIATPVTIVLTENQLYGYIACTQTTFETTDIMTFRINQVGSSLPGSGLIITPHTYRVE